MSRVAEALSRTPLATVSIMALCCLVFLYQTLFDPPLQHYTMCPRNVVHLHEYYRFITSSLFHGGLMHIGMNMMSTAAIGSMLERRFGTLWHVFTILWGILLTSAVYTLASILIHLVLGIEDMMYRHSVGFSGVIFQLSVLEANLSPTATRSVFGFFRVPSTAYPWALLVVLQFVMPNISFWGHLSGILVGTLQLYGVLDVLLPSDEYLRQMEEWDVLRHVTSTASFVKTPAEGAPGAMSHRRDPSGLRTATCRCLGSVWKLVRDVAVTIKVCIFGYGAEANENIQMGEMGALWGSVSGGGASDHAAGSGESEIGDEEDWVGLPQMPSSPGEVESRVL